MRAPVGIGIGIVIFIITFFLVNLFGPDLWLTMAISIIATSLIYFWGVFPNCTFIVPENKAWIMANSFFPESAVPTAQFSGNRNVRAQKEFQAGFHWKFPWDKKGEEIDMQKIIAVEGNPEETYTLAGGQSTKLKYQVLVVPLPGRIVNFNRTKEKDIIRKVKARAEGFLQEYIGGQSVVTFGKEWKDALKARFEGLYGGPEIIDPEEEAMGIWTGTPEIYDIGQPKEVEDARNFEIQMQSVIKTAERMVRVSKDKMKFNEAMKMALVGRGQAKIDFVELTGLLGGQTRNQKTNKRKGGQQNDDE